MEKVAVLTPAQKECIRLMFEEPGMPQTEIARIVGVHRNTIRNWRSNKEFNQAVNEITMEIHNSHLHDILEVLRAKTLDPNNRAHVKYLELALKTYGLLKDKHETNLVIKDEPTESDLLALLE